MTTNKHGEVKFENVTELQAYAEEQGWVLDEWELEDLLGHWLAVTDDELWVDGEACG